jgi:Fe-S cluster assembly protein SufD
MATVALTDKDRLLIQLEGQDFSNENKNFIKLREFALEQLSNLDFPTPKNEDWKYTNVRSIIKGDFRPQSAINMDKSRVQHLLIPDFDAHVLFFVNGFFQAHLSSTEGSEEAGFSVYNLNEAKNKYPDFLDKTYGKLARDEENFFLNLNQAYAQDGGFIHVKKNQKLDKPVHIINVTHGEQVTSNPRHFIYAEKNSEAEIVQTYASVDAEHTFTNAVTEVFVESGAHVYLDKIQQENHKEAYTVALEQAKVDRDANFVINTLPLAGDLVRNNLNILLAGEGSNADLYGALILNGNSHVDNQTFVKHAEPNCTSNELYKSVVNDSSTNVFNGKIYVDQKAQKTNAFQSNANIIISDDAKINSKPQLEIYADDVKCSHGCTIGQFDEEALFYLRARGIKKAAAQEVLLNAFIGEVLDNIKIDAVKEYVTPLIFQNFRSKQ